MKNRNKTKYYDVNHYFLLLKFVIALLMFLFLLMLARFSIWFWDNIVSGNAEIVNPKNRGTQEIHSGFLHDTVLTSRRTSMHV